MNDVYQNASSVGVMETNNPYRLWRFLSLNDENKKGVCNITVTRARSLPLERSFTFFFIGLNFKNEYRRTKGARDKLPWSTFPLPGTVIFPSGQSDSLYTSKSCFFRNVSPSIAVRFA